MIDPARAREDSVDSDVTRRAFESYGVDLHRFLTRRLHCAETARDLAQDAYLRFMLVSRREEIRNTRAFLYRLASNLIYEYRVSQHRREVVYDSDLLEAADRRAALEAGDEAAALLSSAQEVERLLVRLPKAYRAVLLLRKRDGLSADEIAQRLGFTKKTVYNYLTRALAQLRSTRMESRTETFP